MRYTILVLVASLVAVFIPATASLAQQADVRAAFLASNPNNGWEYGFVDEEGSFVAYNSTFDDGNGIAGWCMDRCPGPLGAITINYSDDPIDEYGAHWEPGQICVLPPMNGLSAVIRWHAPSADTVRVDATLTAQTPNASADVALTADGQEVADGQIGSSTSGAPANIMSAASIESSSAGSDELTRSATATVDQGDTVDLAITGDLDQPAGHIGAAIFIHSMAMRGSLNSKAILGKKMPTKQAMLFGVDQWSDKCDFDALVRRG